MQGYLIENQWGINDGSHSVKLVMVRTQHLRINDWTHCFSKPISSVKQQSTHSSSNRHTDPFGNTSSITALGETQEARHRRALRLLKPPHNSLIIIANDT